LGEHINNKTGGVTSMGIYSLAIALLLFILLPPYLENQNVFQYTILTLNTVIIAASILVIQGDKKIRPSHWLMLILAGLPWVMEHSTYLGLGALVIFFVLYSLTSYRIVKLIFKEKEVDLKVIVGVVVGYLMIGIAFTFLSAILVTFYPDAYSLAIDGESSYSFLYYTFVTFSTLGYGDITPAIPQSQSLAVLMTITGQFYMVVVVAIIVGKYISK